MRYLIVRDHDLWSVWNWRERCWAFDLDGLYWQSEGDGWSYGSKQAASERVRAITLQENHNYPFVKVELSKNVRVLNEEEFKQFREERA